MTQRCYKLLRKVFTKYKISLKKESLKKINFPILGHDKVAELLIQKGANVNLVGRSGNTALMYAAQKGKN